MVACAAVTACTFAGLFTASLVERAYAASPFRTSFHFFFRGTVLHSSAQSGLHGVIFALLCPYCTLCVFLVRIFDACVTTPFLRLVLRLPWYWYHVRWYWWQIRFLYLPLCVTLLVAKPLSLLDHWFFPVPVASNRACDDVASTYADLVRALPRIACKDVEATAPQRPVAARLALLCPPGPACAVALALIFADLLLHDAPSWIRTALTTRLPYTYEVNAAAAVFLLLRIARHASTHLPLALSIVLRCLLAHRPSPGSHACLTDYVHVFAYVLAARLRAWLDRRTLLRMEMAAAHCNCQTDLAAVADALDSCSAAVARPWDRPRPCTYPVDPFGRGGGDAKTNDRRCKVRKHRNYGGYYNACLQCNPDYACPEPQLHGHGANGLVNRKACKQCSPKNYCQEPTHPKPGVLRTDCPECSSTRFCSADGHGHDGKTVRRNHCSICSPHLWCTDPNHVVTDPKPPTRRVQKSQCAACLQASQDLPKPKRGAQPPKSNKKAKVSSAVPKQRAGYAKCENPEHPGHDRQASHCHLCYPDNFCPDPTHPRSSLDRPRRITDCSLCSPGNFCSCPQPGHNSVEPRAKRFCCRCSPKNFCDKPKEHGHDETTPPRRHDCFRCSPDRFCPKPAAHEHPNKEERPPRRHDCVHCEPDQFCHDASHRPSASPSDPHPRLKHCPVCRDALCEDADHRFDGKEDRQVRRDRCPICTPQSFCQDYEHPKNIGTARRDTCPSCNSDDPDLAHRPRPISWLPENFLICSRCDCSLPRHAFHPTQYKIGKKTCIKHADGRMHPDKPREDDQAKGLAASRPTREAELAADNPTATDEARQKYFDDEEWLNHPPLRVRQGDPCAHCGAMLLRTDKSSVPGKPCQQSERTACTSLCCRNGKCMVPPTTFWTDPCPDAAHAGYEAARDDCADCTRDYHRGPLPKPHYPRLEKKRGHKYSATYPDNMLPPLPVELVRLYQDSAFLSRIRSYNQSIHFTCVGVDPKKSEGLGKGWTWGRHEGPFWETNCRNHKHVGFGHPRFRCNNCKSMREAMVSLNGMTSHFLPPFSDKESPLRWYIFDQEDQFAKKLDPAKLRLTREVLHKVHELATALMDMGTAMEGQPEDRYATIRLQYEPRANELAAIVQIGEQPNAPRSIAILFHDGKKMKIRSSNPFYETLAYPYLFPHCMRGWSPNFLHPTENGSTLPPIREFEWYRQLLCREARFGLLGRLMSEYIIDMYSRWQERDFNGRRKAKRRVGTQQDFLKTDARNLGANDEDREERMLGASKVPQSVIGSPAHFRQLRQNALEIVRRFGRPTYFITLTCNQYWPEFEELLRPGETVYSRPDITNRVFYLRFKQYLALIKGPDGIFGEETYCIHVIEYQKRGLPHAHIALKVKNPAYKDPSCPTCRGRKEHKDHEPCRCGEPKTGDDIDKVVWARFPDSPDDPLFKKVKHLHMHTCSDACLDPATGLCKQFYPQHLRPETIQDDYGFVQHKRLRPDDGETKGDAWVVHYHRHTLYLWDGSANVQIAHTVKLIFYLFKYLFKGNDYCKFKIAKAKEAGVPVDEMDLFQKGRYISASEACWRVFEFSTESCYPVVHELPIHVEGGAYVCGPEEEASDDDRFETGLSKDERSAQLTNAALKDRARRKVTLLERYFHRPDLPVDADDEQKHTRADLTPMLEDMRKRTGTKVPLKDQQPGGLPLRFNIFRSGLLWKAAGDRANPLHLRYAEYCDNFSTSKTKPATHMKGGQQLEYAVDTHWDEHYVFPLYGRNWSPKRGAAQASVHRLRFLYPTAKEEYCLRQLLLVSEPFATAPSQMPDHDVSVRPRRPNERTGFEDARVVDEKDAAGVTRYIVKDTYEEAALARGLLYDSESECSLTFEEMLANPAHHPHELRFVFTSLVAFEGFPGSLLLQKYKAALSTDFRKTIHQHRPHLSPEQLDDDAYQALLNDLAERFLHHGKTMRDVGLPKPTVIPDEEQHWSPYLPAPYYRTLHCCGLLDTLPPELHPAALESPPPLPTPPAHDHPEWTAPCTIRSHAADGRSRFACSLCRSAFITLNPEQRQIYDEVLEASLDGSGKTFFLAGKSGSGKTTLMRALAARLRLERRIVLVCASTGIAALLHDGGATAHALFKIPIDDAVDHLDCTLQPGSQRAKLLRRASLIIWDEFPNSHRKSAEAVERLLRSLCDKTKPFGGKTMVCAGDFQQIPPVVVGGSRADIVLASVRSSPLWTAFYGNIRKLTRPQRESDDVHAGEVHATGAGTKPYTHVSSNGFPLVHYTHLTPTAEIEDCINFAFPDLYNPMRAYENSRSGILSPKNVDVREINDCIVGRLKGKARDLLSADSIDAAEFGDDMPEYDLMDALSTEFLNTLEDNGVPPHRLRLKPGMIVLVMRNLSRKDGLMNNSKAEVLSISNRYVYVRSLHEDPQRRARFAIPRISFTINIPKCGLRARRRQFPLMPAYCMTYNKAQGQTLDRVALDLRHDAFTHGQLYVAMGRVRRAADLRILLPENGERNVDGGFVTRNVVWPELFLEPSIAEPVVTDDLIRVETFVAEHGTRARGRRIAPSDPDMLRKFVPDGSHFSRLRDPYRRWARNLSEWIRKSPSAVVEDEDIDAFRTEFNSCMNRLFERDLQAAREVDAALTEEERKQRRDDAADRARLRKELKDLQIPPRDAPGDARPVFDAILRDLTTPNPGGGFLLRDDYRKVCHAECACMAMLPEFPKHLHPKTKPQRRKKPDAHSPTAVPCPRCSLRGHTGADCPYFTLPLFAFASSAPESRADLAARVVAAFRPESPLALPAPTRVVHMPARSSCLLAAVRFRLLPLHPELSTTRLREAIASLVASAPRRLCSRVEHGTADAPTWDKFCSACQKEPCPEATHAGHPQLARACKTCNPTVICTRADHGNAAVAQWQSLCKACIAERGATLVPQTDVTYRDYLRLERNCTPDEYAGQIRGTRGEGAWAGTFDLALLSSHYDLEVHVYLKEPDGSYLEWQHFRPAAPAAALHLVYSGAHYDVLDAEAADPPPARDREHDAAESPPPSDPGAVHDSTAGKTTSMSVSDLGRNRSRSRSRTPRNPSGPAARSSPSSAPARRSRSRSPRSSARSPAAPPSRIDPSGVYRGSVNVGNPYYAQIVEGAKSVEARPHGSRGYRVLATSQPGDVIAFLNGTSYGQDKPVKPDSQQAVQDGYTRFVKVLETSAHTSFRAMLESGVGMLHAALPTCTTVDAGVGTYRNIGTGNKGGSFEDLETQHSMIYATRFQLLSLDDSAWLAQNLPDRDSALPPRPGLKRPPSPADGDEPGAKRSAPGALLAARQKAEDDRRQAEDAAHKRAEQVKRRAGEVARKRAEEDRRRAAEEAARKETEKKKRLADEAAKRKPPPPPPPATRPPALPDRCTARGLRNHGNTCYINGVLQCFFHSCHVRQTLLDPGTRAWHQSEGCIGADCMYCALCAFGENLVANTDNDPFLQVFLAQVYAYVTPTGETFTQGVQHDAQEVLAVLYTCVRRALSRLILCPIQQTTMWSQFVAAVGGEQENWRRCPTCAHSWIDHAVTSHTTSLALSLPSAASVGPVPLTLADLIAAQQSADPITALQGQEFQCPRPPSLGRPACAPLRELDNMIRFVPVDAPAACFSITLYPQRESYFADGSLPLLTGLPEANSFATPTHSYVLVACVRHKDANPNDPRGPMASGHYVAYLRDAAGAWVLRDDHSTRAATLAEVCACTPYILFYARAPRLAA